MKQQNNITGIILAGGKSSRMGTDKGFVKLNNKQFVQYSIEALKPLVSKILIVTDNEDYNVFGYQLVKDIYKNQGPVAGIYSGLHASETKNNLILSCDIPLIKTEILHKLIESIDDSDVILIESNGKTMPLIALYKKQCAPIFLKALKNDERRLRHVLKMCNTKTIVLNTNHKTTMNVNTKEELKTIENEYKS
ncbi:molybdenum cofactor guanylyltransferase [Seonamhaeicola algicola]|uniref:Probable molybdenum cofactor guanylyltransferase n=1 Tax=Seonamhaeicola algicola TaxID=1719036 RepID=A0A5C7B528_9FLAO|nr:molybdenum cofactor guanylyltransferase [Seonamhaeicola algicola]TXE15003.1 molybdenum cofactor guanylyltransferase [Seonamhaeicola algicola]